MSRSTLTLRGSIAQTQRALSFGSKIGRVTFEIPESELSKAVALIALQETPLRITIEVDNGRDEDAEEAREKTAIRCPQNVRF